VKPGHTVFVIDDTGTETKGKVVETSASVLTLDVDGVRRPMDSGRVRQVQRYGDSLWNGFLIGVAVGTPGVLIADPPYEVCKDDPQKLCAEPQLGQRVLALAVMGAVGAGIDALIRGRHQVYLAPDRPSGSARRIAISPRLGLTAVGLFVTLDLNKSRTADHDLAVSRSVHPCNE
jgi:hypothetical protein